MARLSQQPLALATALLVPWLSLATPGWLRLAGVAPAWSVLWLLPWALVEGRLPGALAGLGLGLLLDALHPGPVTLVPGLTLLGWWWGRIGRKLPPIQRSFNLGLLALLGSLVLGLSLMLQWALLWGVARQAAAGLPAGVLAAGGIPAAALGIRPALLAVPGWSWQDLGATGLHILLAQTVLTAVLAPMLCSLQLLFWRRLLAGGTTR
ncbi:MAG: rod shape-determining protein MreD [Cyanobium sp.]